MGTDASTMFGHSKDKFFLCFPGRGGITLGPSRHLQSHRLPDHILERDKTMAMTADARGVCPIAPTPFLDDGRTDTASIDRLCDFHLGCGAAGITVPGQLGEAPKLEHSESLDVASRMTARAGRLPVIVGVSAPGFAAMRSLTPEVIDRGAAGVMIAPPLTLRTGDQIAGHYRQAAAAKSLLHRCGMPGSPALRQPAAPLTAAARAKVEHLLVRLARHDPRAHLPTA
jgi:dihydrodipicolinate synthase/N-acetylneuraminate lyase